LRQVDVLSNQISTKPASNSQRHEYFQCSFFAITLMLGSWAQLCVAGEKSQTTEKLRAIA
jgi:hypothetical protein